MKHLLLLCLFALPLSAKADGYGFMTPSGNIYCNGAVIDGYISCAIIQRSSAPPLPKPATCTGVWGHRFELASTGPARMTCDANPPNPVSYSDIAAYGQSAKLGPITCTSEKTGLTCQNPAGHGFFLSRRQQSVY